jgi:hypothetical protein
LDEVISEQLDSWKDAIDHMPLTVACVAGKIQILTSSGMSVQDGIFISDGDPEFVAAQWRRALSDCTLDAPKLLATLMTYVTTNNSTIRRDVIQLDLDISELDNEIRNMRSELNSLAFELYGLDEHEVAVVRSAEGAASCCA